MYVFLMISLRNDILGLTDACDVLEKFTLRISEVLNVTLGTGQNRCEYTCVSVMQCAVLLEWMAYMYLAMARLYNIVLCEAQTSTW